ncbi:signal transduction histidine kinase [Murinocardiopsis flavida]|uniref:histidine kinase n=1 Tax=Murinocardiopsis flavida TaxID=645275 RepID=A0A2P8CVY7_9ACTN|nr:sensor histidine kinase [Murinocardiopsis flavida]PSK89134.1 signal transduction histidine kinase [Murinocardiopsis flavida]
MSTPQPQTPFGALTRRRFLLSRWPWRSLGFVLTSPPVSAVTAGVLALISMPWLIALTYVIDAGAEPNPPQLGLLMFLIVLGTVLVGALGPLVALPLAALERLRLRLVDFRPMASGHRTPGPGLWAWVRTRYTESATWRELAYAVLLATVAPVLFVGLLVLGFAAVTLMLIPVIVWQEGPGQVDFIWSTIDTMGQAVTIGVLGAALLVLLPYPVALLAGAHGALARALLQGRGRGELSAELGAVSRSRARLVDAFEAERRRIERDLHDGAQQRLVTLTLQLGLARLDIPAGSPAADSVADAHDQAKQLMAELRELIRGIHPQILTDRGLPAALGQLADRAAIPVEVRTHIPRRLPGHIEGTAYFVVSEALTNVAKHSGAAAAEVAAHLVADVLVVEVRDDGSGGADPDGGTGLTGLSDRVSVMDGTMVMSSPPGGPTLLRVELPCPQNPPPSA